MGSVQRYRERALEEARRRAETVPAQLEADRRRALRSLDWAMDRFEASSCRANLESLQRAQREYQVTLERLHAN